MSDGEKRPAHPGSMPLVKAHGISRRAPSTGTKLLDDISLSIRGGDRLAIVGPAGAGKTLLLRALALLDPIDTGEISWRGASIKPEAVPAYRSQVMYLHQRPALVPGTVSENLQLPFKLRIYRDRRFDESGIGQLLEAVGRDLNFLSRSDRDLSGGERQLVALLRTLQLGPTILLMDEPTAALDAKTRLAVERLVAQWLAESPGRRTTVWVTHDAEQTDRVADRVLILREGRLADEGGA